MPNPINPPLVPTATRLARTATGGFSNSLAPALDSTDDARFIGPDRSWYDVQSRVTNRLRGSDTMYRTVVLHVLHRPTPRQQILFAALDAPATPDAGGWFMAWGSDGAAISFHASVETSGGPISARVVYSGGLIQRVLPGIGDVLIFTMWTEQGDDGLQLWVRVRGVQRVSFPPQNLNVQPATAGARLSIGDNWQAAGVNTFVAGAPAADFAVIMAIGSDRLSPSLNDVTRFEDDIRARIRLGDNFEGIFDFESGEPVADELYDARDIDREVGAWPSRIVSGRELLTPVVVRPQVFHTVPFMMRHGRVR